MSMLRRLFLSFLFFAIFGSAAGAGERAIIVLDGSGSMWAQIDGVPRITIARQTLRKVLGELPSDLDLGLMTYGAREKGNCKDIALLVPPAPNTAKAIVVAADKISPKGKTPLSEAVRLAAEDLKYTEERATVILITDGLETCAADPCALGTELEKLGVDFTVHVLGFGLSDEEGRKVACLAENTGGKYLSAQDGEGLTQALTETVAEVAEAKPEPEIAPKRAPEILPFTLAPTASLAEGSPDLDSKILRWEVFGAGDDGAKTGRMVAHAYGADFKEALAPGNYILVAKAGWAVREVPVTIVADAVAKPHVVLNAGLLKLRAKVAEGEPADESARFQLAAGTLKKSEIGSVETYWPAGPLHVAVRIGQADTVADFEVAAGQIVDKDIVLGSGTVALSAIYAAGQPVKDTHLNLRVFAAKADLKGNRKRIANAHGRTADFTLPPGNYVAMATLGPVEAEMPFTVSGGGHIELAVNLDAGVLAMSAPGASAIAVYRVKSNPEGKGERLSRRRGTSYEVPLAAGTYLVEAEYKGDVPAKQAEVTIVAGARNEVTID